MTRILVVAAAAAAGFAIGATAAILDMLNHSKAEAQARAVLNSTSVCTTCRYTPVLVEGAQCASCRYRAAHNICTICGIQRVPKPNAPCAVCLTEFVTELDRWGT